MTPQGNIILFDTRTVPGDIKEDFQVHADLIVLSNATWDTIIYGMINSKTQLGCTFENMCGKLTQERSEEFIKQCTDDKIDEIVQLIDLKRLDYMRGRRGMKKVLAYFTEKYDYQLIPKPKGIEHGFEVGDIVKVPGGEQGTIIALINRWVVIVQVDGEDEFYDYDVIDVEKVGQLVREEDV